MYVKKVSTLIEGCDGETTTNEIMRPLLGDNSMWKMTGDVRANELLIKL